MASVTETEAKRPPRGRPAAKQARARRTRALLLDAGERLIAERDFDQTAIADIVAEANSSIGAFYHHFADKDDFLDALIDRVIEGLWRRFDAAFDQAALAGLDTPGLIRLVVGFIRDIMYDSQGLIGATFKKSMEAPEAWTPLKAFARAYEERVRGLLADRAGDFGHADWQFGFRFGMQMVFGTLFNGIVNRPGPLALEDPEIIDELTVMLLRYLQVRDGRPAAAS